MRDPESASDLVDAFWAVARRLRHVSVETLGRWDVSPSQARALAVLARHGDMRPGELARHLRITPRSATEVVDGLADGDLAERGPDPHDRRATIVRLTAKGTDTAEGIRQARGGDVEALFGRLTPDDRAELTRILGELRGHVEADAHGDADPGTPVERVRLRLPQDTDARG